MLLVGVLVWGSSTILWEGQPAVAYGEESPPSYQVLHHRLDTGVTFLWKNSQGIWQYGLKPGDSVTIHTDFNIGQGRKDIMVAPYDHEALPGEEGTFPFYGPNCHWNQTAMAWDKYSYDHYYHRYSAVVHRVTGTETYRPDTGMLTATTSMTLSPREGVPYNIKEQLMLGEEGKQQLLALLDNPSPDILEVMNLMDPTQEIYTPEVEGYLLFHPVVITYNEEVEEPPPVITPPAIQVIPFLKLPTFTYEGHPVEGEDQSDFTVEGQQMPIGQVYGSGLARNDFRLHPASSGTVRRLSDLLASITFPQAGDYMVELRVTPKGGDSQSDFKPIQVGKTPSIQMSIGGIPKENRRQCLTLTVATHPGYPISQYRISIENENTGEIILLTPEVGTSQQPHLKHRPLTVETGSLFTTYQLEFTSLLPTWEEDWDLTLENRDIFAHHFSVEAFVQDEKGDSDRVTQNYRVYPDMPPQPMILMEETFLREKDSNQAFITLEDGTMTMDGDEITRSWGTQGRPLEEEPGYTSLAFGGTGKVGFYRQGVGLFDVELEVQEVWPEGTVLPEFLEGREPLYATTSALGEVDNIPPQVALALRELKKASLFLLAETPEEETWIRNQYTRWMAEFLEQDLELRIRWHRLLGGTPASLTEFSTLFQTMLPYGMEANGYIDESRLVFCDEQRIYIKSFTWPGSQEGQLPTEPVLLLCYDPYSGEILWQAPIDDFKSGYMTGEGQGKYLFLVQGEETLILHKETGARQGILPLSLGSDPTQNYLTEEGLFTLQGETLSYLSLATGQVIWQQNEIQGLAKVGGKLHYLVRGHHALARGILDMDSFQVTQHHILGGEETPGFSAMDYRCLGIDSEGTMILWKNPGTGEDGFVGLRIISVDNGLEREIPLAPSHYRAGYRHQTLALDEEGKCNVVFTTENYQNGGTVYYFFRGINIHTGQVGACQLSSYGQSPVNALNGVMESQGKAYMIYTGVDNWIKNYGNFFMPTYVFTYNMATGLHASAGGPGGLDAGEEAGRLGQRLAVYLNGDNTPDYAYLRVKGFGIPKTRDQEYIQAMNGETGEEDLVLSPEEVTPGRAKAWMNRQQPALKVASPHGGYLFFETQLLPHTTYYYEYRAATLTGLAITREEDSLLKACHAIQSPEEDFLENPWYVVATYEEDFNDGDIHEFFQNQLSLSGGMGGVFSGSGGSRNAWRSYAGQIAFQVPEGMKAKVSFDYRIYNDAQGWKTGVLINNQRFWDDNWQPYNSVQYSGHYTHTALLEPGENTLTCHVLYYGCGAVSYVSAIDNLKVELLSGEAPPTVNAWRQAPLEEGENLTWQKVEGSFSTPCPTLDYGSREMTHETLSLTPQSTSNQSNYTLTIPEGKRAYAFCYPVGGVAYGSSYDGPSFTLSGKMYRMLPHKNYGGNFTIYSGQKMFLGLLAGTTQHTAHIGYRRYASISTFETYTMEDTPLLDPGDYFFNPEESRVYYPGRTYKGNTQLQLFLPEGEHLIQDLRIYYMEKGRKIYVKDWFFQEEEDLAGWQWPEELSVQVTQMQGEETVSLPDPVPVYQKGEYVPYQIYYSDYEGDPSKESYWVYHHTPMNDGLHTEHQKVLHQPIHRFYVDGKYVVTHWQEDDTGNTAYDKSSQPVTLTFYVEGTGEAPWITHIRTIPSSVEYNLPYEIEIGVDDTEKDPLTLTMEVYREGSLIYEETRGPILEDGGGHYPLQTYGNLPIARDGHYQVFAIVRDETGVGMKEYGFQVDKILPRIRIRRLF